MLAGLLHARMGMRTTSQQTDDFLAYGPEMNAMVFNKLSGQVLFEEKNQVLFKEKNQVLFEEKNQVLFEEKNQVLFEEKNQVLFEEKNQVLFEEKNQVLFEEKNQVLFEEKNQVLFEEKNQVLFEEKAQEVERSSRNYLEVMDAQHQDLLSAEPGLLRDQDRHRRNGARPGSKVRHKRQALQDMARPLKQWLYSHRENPYPTKTEKILLALGSHMTLVQVSNWFANARRRLKNTVSNWFANARRRLKNTVRQPDLSWALRIKLYNRYVQGNAERLSVSSEDSGSQDAELAQRTQGPEELDEPLLFPSVIKHEASSRSLGLDPGLCGLDPGLCGLDPGLRGPDPEDCVSPPPKYKSSLLHRYLNDSLRHVMVARRLSDYDHAHFVCRAETADHGLRQSKCDNHGAGGHMVKAQKDATYWREINAAMALTNLAHSSEGPGTRTRTRDQEPGTRTRTRDQEPGTTSCIIQKSSHIAEIKTVKVPLMETY